MKHRRTVTVATALTAVAAVAFGVQAATARPDPPAGAASWDFDADGHADLTVRAARAAIDGTRQAGVVSVAYGTADGPSTARHRILDESREEVPGSDRRGDRFGSAADAGDFDGDGYSDLAVCTTAERSADGEASGLTVLFGGEDGLGDAVAVDLGDPAFAAYQPCQDLEAADFDRDGVTDLALSGEDWLAWAAGGPDARSADGWDFAAIDDVQPGSGGHVDAIGTGDLNGDDFVDLTYAVTGCETCASPDIAYRVQLGGADGFAPGTSLSPGIDDRRELDRLPEPVVGDLDGDGHDDIVLGLPRQAAQGRDGAGTVEIWYGSEREPEDGEAGGREADEVLTQDTSGIPGEAEEGDAFGYSVAIWDPDGDGNGDLAIGVPAKDLDGKEQAGEVVIVPGTPDGPDPGTSGRITRATDQVPGTVRAGARFGHELASRPLPGEDAPGLLVGSRGGDGDAGSITLLGSSGARMLESDDLGL